MARSRRRSSHSVIDQLLDAPQSFDFVQAMRVLEAAGGLGDHVSMAAARTPAGYGGTFRLRFVNDARLRYPSAIISSAEKEPDGSVRMTVAGIGMIGALGTLPYSYTTLATARLGHNNEALKAFLDIFQHRAVELFYGASSKYRLAIDFERRERTGEDGFGSVLRSLAGIEGASLRNRMTVPDDTVLHYAGLFASGPRSADGLEALLRSELRHPVSVLQFVGRWVPVAAEEQTRLGGGRASGGQYCGLGTNAVIGDRVWSAQHSARIVIGPIGREEMEALLPGGQQSRFIADLVRFYCGAEYEFDVQLVMRADAVPAARLARGDGDDPGAARLGQTAWSLSGPSPVARDEAIFPLSPPE